MTIARPAVPEHLRSVVLLARMRDLAAADQVAHVLSLFVPPIDPSSRQWAALCDALDTYDRAERAGTGDLATSCQRVDAAASAVLGLDRPRVSQRADQSRPVQRKPAQHGATMTHTSSHPVSNCPRGRAGGAQPKP